MENRRYDYQPITTRQRLRWPNDAKLALWVSPNIEYFHIDQAIPNFGMSRVPDVRGYSQRDYGARVGVFRLMEVLDKYGIRASAQLNSEVCIQHREIIDEGHQTELGVARATASPTICRLTAYPRGRTSAPSYGTSGTRSPRPPERRRGAGSAPPWRKPSTPRTTWPNVGFDYLCDWGFDDQPIPMRVKSGRMIVVPYEQGLNDINFFLRIQLHSRGNTSGRSATSSMSSTARANAAAPSCASRSTPSSSASRSASSTWTSRWSTSAPTTTSGSPRGERSRSGTMRTTMRIRGGSRTSTEERGDIRDSRPTPSLARIRGGVGTRNSEPCRSAALTIPPSKPILPANIHLLVQADVYSHGSRFIRP